MENVAVFRETGAQWFRLMWVVVGIAALMVAGMAIFSVYRPPKSTFYKGSDWSALLAIAGIAGFFASSLGLFGLWRQWRKPLRLSVGLKGMTLGDNHPLIPWSAVDHLALHWRGKRLEMPAPIRIVRTMRSGLTLLVYVRESAVRPADASLEERWRRFRFGTSHVAELGILEESVDDVLQAIRKFAPTEVVARSGMLEA